MMESEEDSDFAVPLVPPATSTPRVVQHNLPDDLLDQLDLSPVPAGAQAGVGQVLPGAAVEDHQLPVNVEDLCLLCSEEVKDKKEINSNNELKEDILMIYRLELNYHHAVQFVILY
jgi:hypothetical protein